MPLNKNKTFNILQSVQDQLRKENENGQETSSGVGSEVQELDEQTGGESSEPESTSGLDRKEEIREQENVGDGGEGKEKVVSRKRRSRI